MHPDLDLVRVSQDLNLEVLHAAIQDPDPGHPQVVDHDLAAVLAQAVGLVQEVGLLHVAAQDQEVDQGLVLLRVLNHVHSLVVSLNQLQDHQLDQSLAAVLLLIHQLVQKADLHLIRLKGLNLIVDHLLDPGKLKHKIS